VVKTNVVIVSPLREKKISFNLILKEKTDTIKSRIFFHLT